MSNKETPREHFVWAAKIFLVALIVSFLVATPFVLMFQYPMLYITLGMFLATPIFVGSLHFLFLGVKSWLCLRFGSSKTEASRKQCASKEEANRKLGEVTSEKEEE